MQPFFIACYLVPVSYTHLDVYKRHVEEVTIAGNLKDMFKGIVAIGDDVDERGSIRTGSILIDKMTIAGQ